MNPKFSERTKLLLLSDYCMIASLQGCYADGLLLHSLAERLATTIIVFSWNSSVNIWQRSVLSPSLTGGFAQSPKKGMQPVVIALRDRHYGAFCPDNKDVVFPSAWLAETELKDRPFFRGGGSAPTGKDPNYLTVRHLLHFLIMTDFFYLAR